MSSHFEFNTDYHCPIGKLESIAPGLRRITANNPSPLTFRGTGTYVIGTNQVAVIDPGPSDPEHIEALLHELGNETITHILVTHTHHDHSAGTHLLQQHCQAPTYAMGTHTALQRPSALPSELDSAGDTQFVPDVVLEHEECIHGDQWSLQCLHTPGHASNHAAFAEAAFDRVFVGDLVMGWSTPVLLPPDGHLTDYLNSLKLLLSRLNQQQDQQYWPTHGALIENPRALVKHLIEHRLKRIESVFDAVTRGHITLADIVNDAYPKLTPNLLPAAERSTLASVIYLIEHKRLRANLEAGLNLECSVVT